MPAEHHLAHCPPRPREAATTRYPRLLEVGLVALAAGACGGQTGGDSALPFATGGLAPAGAGSNESGGGGTGGGVDPGGTGGMGGTGGTGSGGLTSGGGGGGEAPWDGWLSARVQQATECVGVGQPLDVELLVDQSATSILVRGTRTVAAPPDATGCLMSYLSSACVLPEEFAVNLANTAASEILAGFSSLPRATCTNTEGVECEMPCDAVILTVDGMSYGSSFCCGRWDDPGFAERATEVSARLMQLVDDVLSRPLE